jgi:hypothetical protein
METSAFYGNGIATLSRSCGRVRNERFSLSLRDMYVVACLQQAGNLRVKEEPMEGGVRTLPKEIAAPTVATKSGHFVQIVQAGARVCPVFTI